MASLQPKTTPLGTRLAAHLLRRTTFMVTPARIRDFALKTPDQAITELFTPPPYQIPKGPIAPDGTHWLTDGPYSANSLPSDERYTAVYNWRYLELSKDTSIRHKMAVFFRSIFVAFPGTNTDWRKFEYERLLQFLALGNIKSLAYKMTLDNFMLYFLDNRINKKTAPNENYAREFLELFTILKGPQIGPDNYTNYTEQDVREAARVLTGFTTSTLSNKDPDTGLATGRANYGNHDIGNKQFSSAFQNKIILGATSETDMYRELQEFVDMVFDKTETAKAFVRRMYIFFVHDIISAEIEQDLIEPLAFQLKNDNYEVQNTLKRLLKSTHFFDEDDSDHSNNIVGGKVKPPLELLFQSANLFDANNFSGPIESGPVSKDMDRNFNSRTLNNIDFRYYPTSVEGYPGFFKGGSFSKNWINTTSIINRNIMERTIRQGKTITSSNRYAPFGMTSVTDYFDAHFTNQEYADIFLDQVFEILLPEAPDADRKNYFKEKLLGGLSPINWMFEWLNYKATGDNTSVEIVLTDLYIAIFKSSEFQTY